MRHKLSIVIPVYNEQSTLLELVRRVEDVNLGEVEKEIIIVDDCSTDGSGEVVRTFEKRHRIIRFVRNQGKGAALKAGIALATGDFLVFQDADLEYDPNDLPKLLQPLLEEKAQVTFGSRFESLRFRFIGRERTMPPVHGLGNIGLAFLFNLLYGTHLTDSEPCYKMFRADIIKNIEVMSDRFEYDIELMCKLVRAGHVIQQMPISYHPRSFDEGKKISWRDGITALKTMIRYRFSRTGAS